MYGSPGILPSVKFRNFAGLLKTNRHPPAIVFHEGKHQIRLHGNAVKYRGP
jgi:hypothetical protein